MFVNESEATNVVLSFRGVDSGNRSVEDWISLTTEQRKKGRTCAARQAPSQICEEDLHTLPLGSPVL